MSIKTTLIIVLNFLRVSTYATISTGTVVKDCLVDGDMVQFILDRLEERGIVTCVGEIQSKGRTMKKYTVDKHSVFQALEEI